MKNIFKASAIFILVFSFIACSEEPPSFKIKNDRTTKANVQIKTIDNTINFNDVQPNTITDSRDIAEGSVSIKAEIQNETDEPTGGFNASNDNNYTVVILNSTPPSIRIDISSK